MSSSIGTSSLRHIIQHAAQLLLEDNNSRLGFNIESKCIVKSILHFFATQLTTGLHNSDEDEDMDEGHSRVDTTSWNMLKELLGGFFPSYDIDYSYSKDDTSPVPSVLLEAIKTQLQERHLQFLPSLMEKVGWRFSPSSFTGMNVCLRYSTDQAAASHAQPPGLKVCHLDGAFRQWQVHLSQDPDCSLPAGAKPSRSGTEVKENWECKGKRTVHLPNR